MTTVLLMLAVRGVNGNGSLWSPSVSQPPSGVKFFKACHYGVPRVTCRGCQGDFRSRRLSSLLGYLVGSLHWRKSKHDLEPTPAHGFTEPKTRVFAEQAVKPIGINLKNFYLPEERFDPDEGGMEEDFGILFPFPPP
ncbi:hypothetical protein TNCV_633861 [Trichonephila clavipes]|nr:hypothetical protein TNCV_633861 [Trichonephila clavipes]